MIPRLAVLASMLALSALAQPKPESKAALPKAPKPQSVIFGEGDVIDGTLDGPDLPIYEGVTRPRFHRLFGVRANFNDKLLRSVGNM